MQSGGQLATDWVRVLAANNSQLRRLNFDCCALSGDAVGALATSLGTALNILSLKQSLADSHSVVAVSTRTCFSLLVEGESGGEGVKYMCFGTYMKFFCSWPTTRPTYNRLC